MTAPAPLDPPSSHALRARMALFDHMYNRMKEDDHDQHYNCWNSDDICMRWQTNVCFTEGLHVRPSGRHGLGLLAMIGSELSVSCDTKYLPRETARYSPRIRQHFTKRNTAQRVQIRGIYFQYRRHRPLKVVVSNVFRDCLVPGLNLQ